MDNCRSSSRNKQNSRKSLALILAITGIIVAVLGTTVAYIIYFSPFVKNTFKLSEISCSVIKAGDESTTSVKIKNTGKTAAYIRVYVVLNTVDEDGNITGDVDVSECLPGTGWVKSGLYYYYTQPVASDDTTGELLNSDISSKGKRLTVMAEAIQSEPEGAAQDAWGVSPASLTSN